MDNEALLMLMLVVAAVAVVIGIVLMIGGRGYPYSPQPYLFTKAEQVFLPVLERAAEPYGLRVYGKVRIADVLKVDLPDGSQRFWRWFRLISSKHVDYVLVDPKTYRPIAALELDDSSHFKRDRKERDTFVNKAFASAGIPLIRVPWQRNYSVGNVRAILNECLSEKA